MADAGTRPGEITEFHRGGGPTGWHDRGGLREIRIRCPRLEPSLHEALASYVPVLVTRRLAEDPCPLTEPRSERHPATVLFADISGFTALTELLGRQGPAGVE